ncbi:MAG: sulfite exporter TauE/SafE family protein [Bacteroidales bacterium]|nr:sulfite exporter TauE/SafE family protein [Bacteroidales bacterium]
MLNTLYDYYQQLALSTDQLIWLLVCASLVGMAKTGLSGVGLLVVPVLAKALGARESVGILLPILIIADIFAVTYYNKHANWKHVLKLLPWALVGIVIGLFFGKSINDEHFKITIAVLVIVGIVILLFQDLRKDKTKIPDNWWFAAVLGLAGGFATMVANAAGSILALYLLSMRLPKDSYIGTGAWFFFIVNVIKVPLHVVYWKTITPDTLLLNLISVPAIIVGVVIGIKVVKLLPEKVFRVFIILSTLVVALFLF